MQGLPIILSQGLPSIFSLFRNDFNTFKNAEARINLFNLSHDIKITFKSQFLWHENNNILSLWTQACYVWHS